VEFCPLPSNLETFHIGIITASDRARAGEYEDLSGPAIETFFEEAVENPLVIHRLLLSDDQNKLQEALLKMADEQSLGLIITTGGTGPGPRDVSPEATEAVCDKILPGFGEEMRRQSLNFVPTAILSRQLAGIRRQSLIINLPGSPKAIDQCLSAVLAAIPDCLDQIGATKIELKNKEAFRPH
jgi:molybdopterin adenylyltransferase